VNVSDATHAMLGFGVSSGRGFAGAGRVRIACPFISDPGDRARCPRVGPNQIAGLQVLYWHLTGRDADPGAGTKA
jgi:hypothetical protein